MRRLAWALIMAALAACGAEKQADDDAESSEMAAAEPAEGAPAAAAADTSMAQTITGCEALGRLKPICGFHHPEDMELLPDGHTLIVGQAGSFTGGDQEYGSMAFYDTRTGDLTVVEPSVDKNGPRWGDAGCPGSPGDRLSPHGIHLSKRADGRLQLLVVNHGGRESVEFFEVVSKNADRGLAWRGCAIAPAHSYLNDVAATPDGGFVVTNMYQRDVNDNEGFVLVWRDGKFSELANSRGHIANGIQISADGETLYVNYYEGNEIRKVNRATGEILDRAEIQSPDNVQWDSDGQLLVASHRGDGRDCPMDDGGGPCGMAFVIVAVDPETMATEAIFSHHGAPMGAATVAQRVGDDLYLGSFTGDRILLVQGGSAPE